MNSFPIIILPIIIGLILIGILIAIILWKWKSEGINREPDYRDYFSMGICFLPVGIVLTAAFGPGFIAFVGFGIIYMAIGLANKDKWKDNAKHL
jgi:hypothetical protein